MHPHLPPSPAVSRLPLRSSILVGLLLAVWLLTGCGGEKGRDGESGRAKSGGTSDARPDLLLVTIDTVRADRVGCYGYDAAITPRIDALAAEGVLFENVATPAPLTVPAHASMLTGAYPFQLGVRTNDARYEGGAHPSIAEVLGDAGFDTAAFVGAVQLSKVHGLDRGFDVYDDDLTVQGRPRVERRAGEVVAAFVRWFDTRDDGDAPFFAWVHFYDPHETYDAQPPFGGTGRDPYDEEITYSDHCLGKLLDHLDEERDPRRPLVTAVASDHGEGLGEHGESTHGLFVYGTTVDVPLVFFGPEVFEGGRRVDTRVRLVDVAPTLLDLAGVGSTEIGSGGPVSSGSGTFGDPVTRVPGASLAPVILGEGQPEPRAAFAESIYAYRVFGYHPLASLIEDGWKVIDSKVPELYDLRSDPDESRDLSDAEPERLASMRERVRGVMDRWSPQGSDPSSSAAPLDAARRAQLLALGYVVGESAGGDRETLDPATLPDVKEIGPFLAEFERCMKLLMSNDPSAATEVVRVLETHRPKSPYVYRSMLDHVERFGDAAATRRLNGMLVEVAPEDSAARLRIAFADFTTDPDSSRRQLEAILSREPAHLDALAGMGELHLRQLGDPEGAATYFRKFLEHAPPGEARIARVRAILDEITR